MKRLRPGSPISRTYCRASFIAVSLASEPPETKYILPMPSGARVTRCSARASAGSLVKKPVWAKGRRRTCSTTASTTAGWECPRQDTAAPPEASR